MAKKKKIRAKLIANPGSGKMTGNEMLESVTRYLQERGVELDVALAKPNEKAVPIAKKAVKQGYKLIIALGGDDTIWAVMRGIVAAGEGKTRLGVIAGGTSNNVTRALGIGEEWQKACDIILDANVRRLDIGEISTKKRKKFLFFEVVTIGLASAVYEDLKEVPKGKLAGLKDAITKVVKQPPQPKVFLTLDGESEVKVKTMLVNVSNMPIMGTHFLVAPDASMDDGLLDVSVYPEFSKPELFAYFAQVREEGTSGNKKVQRYRARELKIKTVPKMGVLADGTLMGKGTVKITVRRRALRVICPEAGSGTEIAEPVAADLPAPVAAAGNGAGETK